jgi:predicted metal-dependent phosphoesterase TrpH
MPTQIRVDLHVHSVYSQDSIITPKELVYYAKKRGLNAIAVTDHNCLEGSQKIAKGTNFLIIPGMEVSSLHGHIVALNVSQKIPRDLSADETVDRIHDAGGLAIACHPFALFKGSIGKHVTAKFDAVEAINASTFPFGSACRKARELADRLQLAKVAGTDAHYGPVIGLAYTVLDAETTVDGILDAIKHKRCRAEGQGLPVLMRIENQGRFLKKYVRNRGKPAS